jgi:Uma2 family endonuclease
MSDMAVDLRPRLFTVEEYHRLVEVGVLREGERVELIDGIIVEMSPIGWPHGQRQGLVISSLQRALGERAFVTGSVSLPIDLLNEPEPDGLVVAPQWSRLMQGRPPLDDVYAVIEFAESSLTHDLGRKAPLYARAAVADYLVVDIVGDVLVHHSIPQELGYGSIVRRRCGDTFRLARVPDILLDADALLAPRT